VARTRGPESSKRTRRVAAAAALLLAGLWLVYERPLAWMNADDVERSGVAKQAPPVPYDRAVAMIARRQDADDQIAVSGARSILLTGSAATARAIVLLHGLTDSPRQFEALAYLMHADGNNVFVPRFPQHGLRGGDARALAALSATELRRFADSVMMEAGGLGDSVVAVGLSLGGTVAAYIVQQHVAWRAVLIAPAVEPGRIPSILDRPIIGLADRLPNVTRRSPREAARPDREPGFSTHAAAEVLELGRAVLYDAARVAPRTRRIAVLVNANDRTVRESAAEALARDWERHGAAVSMFELPDSLRLPHNVLDPVHGRMMENAVLELLRELAYGAPPPPLVRSLPVH
jgi:esterase/lipase